MEQNKSLYKSIIALYFWGRLGQNNSNLVLIKACVFVCIFIYANFFPDTFLKPVTMIYPPTDNAGFKARHPKETKNTGYFGTRQHPSSCLSFFLCKYSGSVGHYA